MILVSTEWIEISAILPNFCNSILSKKKLRKVGSINHLKILEAYLY